MLLAGQTLNWNAVYRLLESNEAYSYSKPYAKLLHWITGIGNLLPSVVLKPHCIFSFILLHDSSEGCLSFLTWVLYFGTYCYQILA